MTKPTHLPAWEKLQAHFQDIKALHMGDLFAHDPARFDRFSLQLNDILFDYSKNRITPETLDLLVQLAEQADVEGWRERMFNGEMINHTERRSVMHTALREQSGKPTFAQQVRIDEEIKTELDRVKKLAENIRSRTWRGHSNQPITDVVNIGIGGSHLGPMMVTEALHPYAIHDLRIHYVSNIDENHINNTLETLNPDTTLFIIASKSFTTQETLVNANTAKTWLLKKLNSPADLGKHLVAILSNIDAVV